MSTAIATGTPFEKREKKKVGKNLYFAHKK